MVAYLCSVLFARAPVLGRCFFVSVKQYCPTSAVTPQLSVGMNQENIGGAGGGNTGGGGNGSLVTCVVYCLRVCQC